MQKNILLLALFISGRWSLYIGRLLRIVETDFDAGLSSAVDCFTSAVDCFTSADGRFSSADCSESSRQVLAFFLSQEIEKDNPLSMGS